jgi:hypothetical protein
MTKSVNPPPIEIKKQLCLLFPPNLFSNSAVKKKEILKNPSKFHFLVQKT